MSDYLFIDACFQKNVPRVPVWMMRQAGRYLPQYQAVRSKVTFLELCKTPSLACEVTVQPIDEFGMDAAILFCDILIPVEAMGLSLDFTDKGPVFANPIRSRGDINKLSIPDPHETMPFVMDAIGLVRKQINVPLICFSGAPFTLASYAIEGSGSKNYVHLKSMLFSDPKSAHILLGKLAETCTEYLKAQVASGAQAVQLFDSWAGILSPHDFKEFALRYAKQIIESLKASKEFSENPVPIIYFVNGCAPYLEMLKDCGADVLGCDWRVDLAHVRHIIGNRMAIQGNMDPTALLGTQDYVRHEVKHVVESAGEHSGYIFNLGHGILPMTNPEHVRVMVEAVHQLTAQ